MVELAGTGSQIVSFRRSLLAGVLAADKDPWFPLVISYSFSTSDTMLEEARRQVRTADLRSQSLLARQFAKLATAVPGVKEVWLVADADTLVAVVTEDNDLERDLQLEAFFRIVAQTHRVPLDAQLGIYAETDSVPEAMRVGERLA